MKLELKKVEDPFVMVLTNENGSTCHLDANEIIGGKGSGFRPMELLAGSLASCVAIDVLAILKKKKLDTSKFEIQIEGSRGEGVPAPFKTINLLIVVAHKVNLETVLKASKLVLKKYCSVAASLDQQIKINIKSTHHE